MVILLNKLQLAELDRTLNYLFQMDKIWWFLDGVKCAVLYGGVHQLHIV